MAGNQKKDTLHFIGRVFLLLAVTAGVAMLTRFIHMDRQQIFASSVFIMIVVATLLFWEFRLAIAFVGISVLMGTRTLDLPTFIKSCQLDVILFLVGMMVIVGVLKELGLFTWIIQGVIKTRRMTGPMFVVIFSVLSALMGCIVDEVTSIVFIATLIFQVCDTLKVRPLPFIIIAVMATNIGSTGTMLGNPVGILIGQNSVPPLGFPDFMKWSFPIMLVTLSSTICLLLWWFRRDIRHLSEQLEARREMGLGLGPLVKVPYKRGLGILLGMVVFIALHRNLESYLGLAPNTILIVAPILIAGLLMVWRHERARHYIEADVEWWTLIFFMMLFAVAGSLERTGVTEVMAGHFQTAFGNKPSLLMPVILGVSALGSAFVDNVVFVAAFIPIVNKLGCTPLIWALLQGACLGGNATMIGSTANIVVLGMVEKRYRTHVRFFEWLKAGAVVAVFSCLIAWGGLVLLSPYMPTKEQRSLEAVEVINKDGIEHIPATISPQSKEDTDIPESNAKHQLLGAEAISK
ncbi:MAG: SLC13 family permease [Phycisphaerae bacterium]|jgi:Na+/H+ antiporter NhaD/arsenite permease-like protein